MKKPPARKSKRRTTGQLRDEYRVDFSRSKPNRFASRVDRSGRVVALDPDVSRVFTTPHAANKALRALIQAIPPMEKPMNSRRLPQTDSIQELAKFWDTHDVTEFEDQLEEVQEPVFERETDIMVHLQTADAQALREMARLRGVPESELIREWVLERIHAT